MITLKPKFNSKLAWQLYRLAPPKPKGQGFAMLEVLVAMMITFGFLMATLNAMTAATMVQVQAERRAAALYWIQQDLENIQALADAQATDADGNPITNECSSTFSTSYAGRLNTATAIPVAKYQSTDPSPTYTTGTNSLVATAVASSIIGGSYTMTRTTAGTDTNPQLLTIRYRVQNASDPDAIATLYTEVIPPRALNC